MFILNASNNDNGNILHIESYRRRGARSDAFTKSLYGKDIESSLISTDIFSLVVARDWQRVLAINGEISYLALGHSSQGNSALLPISIRTQIAYCITRNLHRVGSVATQYHDGVFGIFLPGFSYTRAIFTAERIAFSIQMANIKVSNEQIVTPIMGLRTVQPIPGSTPVQLVQDADLALFNSEHPAASQEVAPFVWVYVSNKSNGVDPMC